MKNKNEVTGHLLLGCTVLRITRELPWNKQCLKMCPVLSCNLSIVGSQGCARMLTKYSISQSADMGFGPTNLRTQKFLKDTPQFCMFSSVVHAEFCWICGLFPQYARARSWKNFHRRARVLHARSTVQYSTVLRAPCMYWLHLPSQPTQNPALANARVSRVCAEKLVS